MKSRGFESLNTYLRVMLFGVLKVQLGDVVHFWRMIRYGGDVYILEGRRNIVHKSMITKICLFFS